MTKKIMIIDDEQSSLFLMKAILTTAGYTVITESQSTKALDVIKKEKPNLVLMDLVMPEINGVELAQKIEDDAALKGVHVFAFTGMPIITDNSKKHFEKIILKPFHTTELLAEIKDFFATKK